MTSRSVIEKELVLDGVVTYALGSDNSGRAIMDARWVSSRTVSTNQTGTGRAIRKGSDHDNDGAVKEHTPSFEGDWHIEYFGPEGQLAVTPFLLRLKKNNQVRGRENPIPVSLTGTGELLFLTACAPLPCRSITALGVFLMAIQSYMVSGLRMAGIWSCDMVVRVSS